MLNPQAVQSTWNAWQVVAALAGGIVMHAYHSVVRAGGMKTIWRNFWSGPGNSQEPTEKTEKP